MWEDDFVDRCAGKIGVVHARDVGTDKPKPNLPRLPFQID
jgi:hypothetical protein